MAGDDLYIPSFDLLSSSSPKTMHRVQANSSSQRQPEKRGKDNKKTKHNKTRNTESADENTYGDEGRDAQVADIALHGHCCWLRSAASVQCRPGDERRRSLNMAFAGGEVKGFKASPPMWRNKGKGHPSSPIGSPLISHGTVYPL